MANGRPKQDTGTALSRHVGIRFDQADRARVEALAAGAGVSLSEYVRAAALKTPAPVRRGRVSAADRAANAAAVSEVNRIGVNLNQLVRGHHYGSGDPMRDDLAATLAEVRAWLERNV